MLWNNMCPTLGVAMKQNIWNNQVASLDSGRNSYKEEFESSHHLAYFRTMYLSQDTVIHTMQPDSKTILSSQFLLTMKARMCVVLPVADEYLGLGHCSRWKDAQPRLHFECTA